MNVFMFLIYLIFGVYMLIDKGSNFFLLKNFCDIVDFS